MNQLWISTLLVANYVRYIKLNVTGLGRSFEFELRVALMLYHHASRTPGYYSSIDRTLWSGVLGHSKGNGGTVLITRSSRFTIRG